MQTVVTPLTPDGRYRELTYEQKRSIRARLDALFDADAGQYRDGASDHRVGEALGIPWSIVRFVRERDYGVILPPGKPMGPEHQIDQLTARVTAMEDELHKLRGHLNALRAELGPDVA